MNQCLEIYNFYIYDMSSKTLTENFIEKAKKVHNDTYNYSQVEYKNRRVKIKIYCKEHGMFEQEPRKHLEGQNCRKCENKKRTYTKENFIEKANKIHKNKYDYSKTDYKKNDIKIIITCKKHSDFKQMPTSHLQGFGCPDCGKEVVGLKVKKTTEYFIKKAEEVHGDKYNYSLTEYISTRDKVEIICKEHGIFEQGANKHTQGRGCPKCARELSSKFHKDNPVGWSYTNWQKAGEKSKSFHSFKVYIIRCWNEEEEFYKIGKTFATIRYRFKSITTMPYNYEIIQIHKGGAREMSELEKELQKNNKDSKYIPKINFVGIQECYKNYTI